MKICIPHQHFSFQPISGKGKSQAFQIADNRQSSVRQAKLTKALQLKKNISVFMPSSKVAQRVTEITYNSTTINYQNLIEGGTQWQTVGTETVAWIDPFNAKVGSRTVKGDGIYSSGIYKRLNGGRCLVQGHLLNANLGGQAMPNNLFPITSEMNHNHSTMVEQAVKNMVITAHNLGGGRRVYYRVKVNPPGGRWALKPANIRQTTFTCQAYITLQDGVTRDPTYTYINTDVFAPNNLDESLAALGFAPETAPHVTLINPIFIPTGGVRYDVSMDGINPIGNVVVNLQ